MSKSLLRQLSLWTAPALVLTLTGALFLEGLSSGPKFLGAVLALLAGQALIVLALRQRAIAPLQLLHRSIRGLRSTEKTLPKELPVRRGDEIGAIAREAALLAGDRNVALVQRQEAEAKTAALVDAIPDAIMRVDRDGLIVNLQFPKEGPFFLDETTTVGVKLKEIFPATVTDRCVDALARVFMENEPQHFVFDMEIDGEAHSYVARIAQSGEHEALAIIRDTTRQQENASSHARLNAILDATIDPILTVALDGELSYINPAGRRLLGIEEPTRFGLRILDFLPEWARQQVLEVAIPTAEAEGCWHGDSALLTTHEVEIPISITAVAHPSPKGDVKLISFIARDQSERKRFDDHLLYLADHDPLTALFTRRRYVEELGREIARGQRSGAGGAVLILDLDDFKYVNDSLGHRTGDKLLSGLAKLLKQTVRANDIIARLDGDEFAVLVTETSASRIEFVSERLLKTIRNFSVMNGEQPVGVTASVGIAFFPEHGATAEELLAHADQALDRAKQQGRDQFVFYQPDKDRQANVDSRLSGEKRIRDALSRGRFLLFAQPILELASNEVTQFEILIRMLDEQDKIIPPAAFLSTAERFGLIRSVDRWVVRQAIGIIGGQKKIGHDVNLSVNLSGKSLADLELANVIEYELAKHGVDPSQLTLEITETTAIADTERAQRFAHALKEIGCSLALDDFGVGFSSLNHLKHLPVDYLKIDGSFIRDLPKNKVDQHLVRAMVEVARALGKRTVAEFVTDQETLELLKGCGVDYGQGYHIGKPDAVENQLSSPQKEPEEQAAG